MAVGTLRINLNAISNNWKRLNALSKKGTQTSAVVKANAYGLGIQKIAPCLWNAGARIFFVATLQEGIDLRTILSPDATIYYLNGYDKDHCDAVIENNLVPVLNSFEQIAIFKSHNIKIPVAIQFDIGMNRLGIKDEELLNFNSYDKIKCLKLKLIIGHLSSADDKLATETSAQFKSFQALTKFFPGTPRSLSATGGILLGKKFHFELTRPGIGLFGGYPFLESEPVINLDLPILQVKEIKAQEGVGYNHTFIAKHKMRIAVVSAGYADGLSRILSNSGFLYASKIKCPIIGRISMDLITVDVSSLEVIPSTLQVLGTYQTIDDLAFQAKTIGYEVLSSLGSRYERVYNIV